MRSALLSSFIAILAGALSVVINAASTTEKIDILVDETREQYRINMTSSPMTPAMRIADRAKAAVYGMMIGDALSMPVHWYYNPRNIQTDFGRIIDFQPPKAKHPSSIMSLSNTGGAGRGSQQGNIVGDVILHGKKQFWGVQNMHYHQGMKAGENTLNAVVARLLLRTLVELESTSGSVSGAGNSTAATSSSKAATTTTVLTPASHVPAFLQAYVKFMTTPGSHNDTYAETYHRMFFKNYVAGKPASACADDDGHNVASMGGLVLLPPVILLHSANLALPPASSTAAAATSTTSTTSTSLPSALFAPVKKATSAQMYTTHNSKQLEGYATVYAEVLGRVLLGEDLQVSIKDASNTLGLNIPSIAQGNPGSDDTRVIGSQFSSACYIEDSLPSLLYLAYKYSKSPEDALIANTNVGGENCHRGAVLGALMGASKGMAAWPKRWIDGLHAKMEIEAEAEAFGQLCAKRFLQMNSGGAGSGVWERGKLDDDG